MNEMANGTAASGGNIPAVLRAKLEAARSRADAAAGLIDNDMRAEIDARAEIAKHEEAVRSANREARQLVIDRAIDVARERFPGEALEQIDLEDVSPGAGAYVLRCPPHKSVADWQARMADPSTDAKARDGATRNMALMAIVAWIVAETSADGQVTGYTVKMNLDDARKNTTQQIGESWTNKAPGAPTSIVNVATDLAGFVAAKRKS